MAWALLSLFTGRPLTALALVVAFAWIADGYAFRVLPRPLRALARRRREAALRRRLRANPHDRRARFELAELVLGHRPAEAAALARSNVAAGDEDAHTLLVLGAALARTGHGDAADRVLDAARAADPRFRAGEIDLELGSLRLARGDLAGAREALDRLVVARPGTVRGRYLLARALDRAGDAEGAARVRGEAWAEYLALPRFRRREERRWAWAIRPARGVLAVAVLLAGCVAALAAAALALGHARVDGRATAAGSAGAHALLADGRVMASWSGNSGGHLTWLVVRDAPGAAAPEDRFRRQVLDLARQRVRVRGAWVPLVDAVPRAYVFEGDRVVAELAISMRTTDLVVLHRLTRYEDVVAYLRRFEVEAPRPAGEDGARPVARPPPAADPGVAL